MPWKLPNWKLPRIFQHDKDVPEVASEHPWSVEMERHSVLEEEPRPAPPRPAPPRPAPPRPALLRPYPAAPTRVRLQAPEIARLAWALAKLGLHSAPIQARQPPPPPARPRPHWPYPTDAERRSAACCGPRLPSAHAASLRPRHNRMGACA